MPAASFWIIPARSISLWLIVSASEGSSLSVRMNAFFQYTCGCSGFLGGRKGAGGREQEVLIYERSKRQIKMICNVSDRRRRPLGTEAAGKFPREFLFPVRFRLPRIHRGS